MSKISYEEYLALVDDPSVDDETLLKYVIIVPGEGGFDFTFAPNPETVEVPPESPFESALTIGNNFFRGRRRRRFLWRQSRGVNLPILVSEGDSWFQFPLLIKDVIDHLEDHFLVWSLGAAGDTANNMVRNMHESRKTEYLNALISRKDQVKGFLFSGAGNDVIGQNPDTEEPVLIDLLNEFNGDASDVLGHINQDKFNEKLDFIEDTYRLFIRNIRAISGLENLPIFIHGYDYNFPYPWGENDWRDPTRYAAKDQWLGRPLNKRGIIDQQLRRNIIIYMIDALYDRLEEVAGDSATSAVWLIDCRGAMPDVEDWADEIHGTSEGFAKVGARFLATIQEAINR